MKGQKIIFPVIVSVVFVSLIFVLNYSSIYADESIVDVQLTVPQTTPFGENAEIVISSHSDTVFDRALVNAEHKILRLQGKADGAQQKVDDAQTAADIACGDGDARKCLRLLKTVDRLEPKAVAAEAELCAAAAEAQAEFGSGKSTIIDNVVDACP